MSLSQQAATVLAAIQSGTNIIQVHRTPEVGEYRAGIAWPGGHIRQGVSRRTVAMLRRQGYIALAGEVPLSGERIAAEYCITAAGLQALHNATQPSL